MGRGRRYTPAPMDRLNKRARPQTGANDELNHGPAPQLKEGVKAMGFRFRRRIKLVPGFWLNLSRSGGSASVRPHAATVTLNRNGAHGTASPPGYAFSYRTTAR